MRTLWISFLLLLAASGLSWAAPAETSAMESCTAEQRAVLVTALGRSAHVPKNVQVSIGQNECREIETGKTLAIAVFVPLKPALDENASIEERYDRDFKFFAGLFDLKRRRFIASYSKPFPSSGWIEISGHGTRVHPRSYGTGKHAAFAISHGQDRPPNAADFHADEELTLFMRSGTSLLPVIRSLPLKSTIALTQGGGICCAHVILQVTRELIPAAHRTRGMPDLEIRAQRELIMDESRGPVPADLENVPAAYSYTMQFDGKAYQAVNSKVADPWDDLDR
jgi:hypothetical protein